MASASQAIQKWAEDKPPLLALACVLFTVCADEMVWGLQQVCSEKGLPSIPAPPNVKRWLRMYKNHRRMFDAVGELFGMSSAGHGSASALAAELRQWDRMSHEDKVSALKTAYESGKVREVCEAMRQGIGELAEEARAGDEAELSLEDERQIRAFYRSAEGQFLIRVWLPCWIHYRIWPTRLYRQARQGDTLAMERLLRLDKAITCDRRIAEELHQAACTSGRARFHRLAEAFKGVPKGKLTKAKVKAGLAGLMSSIAAGGRRPMTEPEIRGVFDGVAKERGELRDHSLPLSPEGFAKAIQRERSTWPVPWSDKNRP